MSTGIRTRHKRWCPSKADGCKCDPSYQINVWDNSTGKRVWKTYPTKTAARLARQDAVVAVRTGELSADRGPTLKDAVAQWLAAMEVGHERNRSGDEYKPAAIKGYRDTMRLRVLPTFGDHRVREITTQDVQRWIDKLTEDGWQAATIDAALTPLKAYYRRALVRGLVTTNPTTGVLKPAVRPKAKTVASPRDAEAALAALDPADRPLWATAFYTGLRRGELIGLRPDDVDLAAGRIYVRRGWDMTCGEVAPKSRQGKRTVPVPAVLRDYLDEHLLSREGEDRVFLSQSWVAKANDRARTKWEAAGLPVMTLHGARHTYASLMIAAGVNAKTLSTFMGHATIAITLDLYGHLFPGAEDDAAALLDAYLAREVGGSTVAPVVAQTACAPLASQ